VLAQRYFPGRDPLGRWIRVFGERRTVVGVVSDVHDFPADPSAVPANWMPLAQVQFARVMAAVRTRGEPLTMAAAVRAAVGEVDGELAAANVRTMQSIARAAFAERNFALWWRQMFAAIAAILAGIGAYAMLAYNVELRHREIGIRTRWGLRGFQLCG
jgi:hypothetical protein